MIYLLPFPIEFCLLALVLGLPCLAAVLRLDTVLESGLRECLLTAHVSGVFLLRVEVPSTCASRKYNHHLKSEPLFTALLAKSFLNEKARPSSSFTSFINKRHFIVKASDI